MNPFIDALMYALNSDLDDEKTVKEYLHNIELKTASVRPQIVDVIFNAPHTIVKWSDETKTVVKCGPEDKYDKEKGLAMAVAKKYYGNDNDGWYEKLSRWLKEKSKPKPKSKEKPKEKEKKSQEVYVTNVNLDELKKILGLPW